MRRRKVWVLFAVRMDAGSEFQMGAVLEKKFCFEKENKTKGITILRLGPRVIEGGMCCKWGLMIKMCCPETRECRVNRSLINRLC